MTQSFNIKQGDGTSATVTGASLTGSGAVPVDGSATNQPVITNSTLITGGTITRPANTTAYASGQLVANNTVGASVTPIQLTVARANDKAFTITKGNLVKSSTTTTNAQFRLHFWNVLPTVTNGDGGALSATKAGYLGSIDVDMSINTIFNDGARGSGSPLVGNSIIGLPASGTQIIYCLIEARGAYSPANAETFTPYLEIIQD